MRHGPASAVAALVARLPRGLRRQVEQALRQPRDLLGRAQRQGPGLRRVEHVVAEARRQLGQLGLDGVEARLRLALEADAAQLRVAHQRLDDAALGGVERGPGVAGLDRLQRLVDRLALAEPDEEGDHLGLHRGVRRTQRVAVAHRHQVTDRSPRERQPVGDARDRLDDGVPRRRGRRLEAIEIGAQLGAAAGACRARRARAVMASKGGGAVGVEERVGFDVGHAADLAPAQTSSDPWGLGASTMRRAVCDARPRRGVT